MNVELLLTKLLDLLGRQETERGRDILCRDDGLKNQSCPRTIDIDQSNLDPLTRYASIVICSSIILVFFASFRGPQLSFHSQQNLLSWPFV